MSTDENQPIVTTQTVATNEPVETVLSRYREGEIIIPTYQRDAEEWDDVKKSLFIESVLNRLTIPSFYLASDDGHADRSEVVDGQQRLTTLAQFFDGKFPLLPEAKCPYFGKSIHYAGLPYEKLDDSWKRAFRRYTLTMVTLPVGLPLELRLEIFRRINEGGTPLSGQDIRLGYYSESSRVRYIQLVGIYDSDRIGARRMIDNAPQGIDWPWKPHHEERETWRSWWSGTQTALGQTASEMFLWYVVSRCRLVVDRLLNDKKHLQTHLNLTFRNSNEEVLDIVCAQLRHEDLLENGEPNLLPSLDALQNDYFARFRSWFHRVISHSPGSSNVARFRPMALLIAGLDEVFGSTSLSESQWGIVSRFLKSSRKTAEDLHVEIPESKGRWLNSQRSALDKMVELALAIKSRG